MGFKQREKKRKKAAMKIAQARARASDSASSRWWLTIVSADTCCARCGGMLRVGRTMYYRHTPRAALCAACGEGDSTLIARPSRRWEQERWASQKGRRR
jgi:hypothetical protein